MKFYYNNGQPFDVPYRIETGLDKKKYVVFENEMEAENFAQNVLCDENAAIASFGGFMNAVLFGEVDV